MININVSKIYASMGTKVLEGEFTSPANSSSMGTKSLRSTLLAMKNSLQV